MSNYRLALRRMVAALGIAVFTLCQPLGELAVVNAANLYREVLEFDSDGNLRMTTRDKKATGGTKYRTIGWTIKRYSGSVSARERARIKLTQTSSVTDPKDSKYVYTSFVCTRAEIFGQIGEASKAWQKQLFQNGGMVYLDAIMTIVEDSSVKGSMDADGTLHGEVYTTAEGIMYARGWSDPGALRTHYNKSVFFSPQPDIVEPEEEHERDKVILEYGEEECSYNTATILSTPASAPTFDVSQAIPTGETVVARGALQKYYYTCVLRHYTGVETIPVDLTIKYTLTYKEGKKTKKDTITDQRTVYVQRSYSYYRIRKLNIFALSHARIENGALPDDVVEVQANYTPSLNIVMNQDKYVKIPSASGTINGGDITDGSTLSYSELQSYAEGLVGQLTVRNDRFWIDGERILRNAYSSGSAPEPLTQTGAKQQKYTTQELLIPHTKRNAYYETNAFAVYKKVYSTNTATGRLKRHAIGETNDVTVHTPVVCKGGCTDDMAYNQQVTPTNYLSLVLGREFTVGISTYGTHRAVRGYGTRDYEKYVSARQVQFPFQVYYGYTRYPANTWINIAGGQATFFLPLGVAEGDYTIRFRTLAKNVAAMSGGSEQNGYLANLQLTQYGAYDTLKVTVVGRMYDLAITDIVDYPRWRSVFYNTDGTKKESYFWIGRRNADGATVPSRQSSGIFPILFGDHPYNPNAKAIGLGYRVKLRLKTVGDMRGSTAQIVGVPTYYHISSDKTTRKRVRLYRKDDLVEIAPRLIFTASDRSFVGVYERNVADTGICAQSLQVWDGEYQLSPDLQIVDASVDLDAYIREHGGRLGKSAPIFYQDGYLLVSFELRSYKGAEGTAHLSYINAGNSGRGYCNMWSLQGFSYKRTDGKGEIFSFSDGDCLLFDIRHNLHTDYESWGTH